MVRIGPKWVGRGLSHFIGSPVQSYREANSKSDFMRTRALTRMRELAELRNQVKGQTKIRSNLDAAAYALMLRAQQMVDIPTWWGAYEKAIAGHPHVFVKPGWGLPIKSIQVRVISAAGQHITEPLPGAGQANSLCAAEPAAPVDDTESARSVGVMITYGQFRFLDLGDLTKKKELEIACPNNLLGRVDLFLVTHHGADLSNPKALVWALHPQVAIIDNGARKGASPAAWQVVHDSPGLQDVWQLHYAQESDKAHNTDPERIANVKENCEGKFLKVTAEKDGSFTVINGRTGEEKKYSRKP
jgi:hypothetical protein